MDSATIRGLESQIETGDEESLAILWESNSLVYRGSLAAQVTNESDREDLRQEAFLNALKAVRAKKFKRQRGSFSTWTKAIANNIAADFYRCEKRKVRVISKFAEQCVPMRNDHFLPSNTLDGKIVRDVLSKMKSKDAELLLLAYFNRTPLQSIALLYNIPLGTVKSWLFRAKERFRTILAQESNEEEMEDIGFLRKAV